MIHQAFSGMITIMLAKFCLNDVPHAAGMLDDSNEGLLIKKEVEEKLRRLRDELGVHSTARIWVDITSPKHPIRWQHYGGSYDPRGREPESHSIFVIAPANGNMRVVKVVFLHELYHSTQREEILRTQSDRNRADNEYETWLWLAEKCKELGLTREFLSQFCGTVKAYPYYIVPEPANVPERKEVEEERQKRVEAVSSVVGGKCW